MALNESYGKSQKGLLKLFVIVTTCIAFAVIIDGYDDYPFNRDRLDFFKWTHIAGFIVAIVIFLVHVASLETTLGSARCWQLLNLLASLVLGILCMVSSGLLCDYASEDTEKLIVCLVFGFLSGLLFLIDALVNLREVRG